MAEYYDAGSITVTNGSTTVVGQGTNFEPYWGFGYPLFVGGLLVPIASVQDNTHLTLQMPWPGATMTEEEDYMILFLAGQVDLKPLRENIRQLNAALAGATIMVHVPDGQDEPDGSLGEDGWFAVKVVGDENGSAWKFWLKDGGVWVPKGAPLGLNPAGVWDDETDYLTNDIVSDLGVVYRAKRPNTDKRPETNPDDWEVLLERGERFDLIWSDSDQPASGETILRFPMTTTVTFPAGMSQSRAIAVDAPTADAVFSCKKNGVEFATYTFAAGETQAVFACPAQTTFNPGDVYSEVAPAPRDSTLRGVSAAKVGFR